MATIRTAVISVADKTGLPQFARRLRAAGVDLLCTEGTGRLLCDEGIPVRYVHEYTGFPPLLNGAVKTLHPKLHAGVLAARDDEDHRRQMAQHDIQPIDMVVVNLYPVRGTLHPPQMEQLQSSVSIDIGGHALIRSAAKNYTHVAVVTDPDDYEPVAAELQESGGQLGPEILFRLAVKAFRHTAHYDEKVAEYLVGIHGPPAPAEGEP